MLRKLKMVLLISGISLCLISILLLIITALFPTTYFIIALGNAFVLPFLWGTICILFFFLLSKNKILYKVIYFFIVICFIKASFSFTLFDAIYDIKAVVSDELYRTEGEIIDTYIEERMDNDVDSRSGRIKSSSRYFQIIYLNNANKDEFSMEVDNLNDYAFELNKRYNIIVLPRARTILKYEETP